MRLSGLMVLCAAAGCSDGEHSSSAPRIVLRPGLQQEVDGPVLAGALWLPEAGSVGLEAVLMDAVRLDQMVSEPTIEQDTMWAPVEIPPREARRCLESDCGTEVSLGLIVAVLDRNNSDSAAVDVPEPTQGVWDLPAFAAIGPDAIVGLATDYVVAYASEDLLAQGASLLGWPVAQGVHVMRVQSQDRRPSLAPVAQRERVPLFLISNDAEGEHLACCGATTCAPPAIVCPDVSRIE